jgi:hypothetical protein
MISVANKPNAGVQVATGTGSGTGPFNAIFVVAAATFSAWSESGLTGTMTGIAFPANSWIYGNINSFTLTSGTVRAYKV